MNKMKVKSVRLVLGSLLVAFVMSSCAGSASSDTTAASETTLTTEAPEPPTTDGSDTDYFMVCTPGTCSTMDSTYLDAVKRALPSAYLSTVSDNQLFEMAATWCRSINEPGGWEKIQSFIKASYAKGIKNDYNLFVWTLLGAAGYCFDKQTMIFEWVGKQPTL